MIHKGATKEVSLLGGGAARKDLSVLIVGEKCPKRELELIEHLLVLSRLS